jgi:hypothetical protein
MTETAALAAVTVANGIWPAMWRRWQEGQRELVGALREWYGRRQVLPSQVIGSGVSPTLYENLTAALQSVVSNLHGSRDGRKVGDAGQDVV